MTRQDEQEMNLINRCNPNLFRGMDRVGIIKCKCGRLKEWFNGEWDCICENHSTSHNKD
jgi:hypothetical protein